MKRVKASWNNLVKQAVVWPNINDEIKVRFFQPIILPTLVVLANYAWFCNRASNFNIGLTSSMLIFTLCRQVWPYKTAPNSSLR